MKLKTILVLGKDGRAIVDYGPGEDVDHDALAAHAMLRAHAALREEMSTHGSVGFAMQAVIDELDKRADELMREWGVE